MYVLCIKDVNVPAGEKGRRKNKSCVTAVGWIMKI